MMNTAIINDYSLESTSKQDSVGIMDTPWGNVFIKGAKKIYFLSESIPFAQNILKGLGEFGGSLKSYMPATMAFAYDEINLLGKGEFESADKQSEKITKFVCSVGCKTVGSMSFSPIAAKLVCPAACNAVADYMGGKEMSTTDKLYKFGSDIVATTAKELLFVSELVSKASVVPHVVGLGASTVGVFLEPLIKQPIADMTSTVCEYFKVADTAEVNNQPEYTTEFNLYDGINSFHYNSTNLVGANTNSVFLLFSDF